MSSKTDAVCIALTTMWKNALTGVSVVDGPQANKETPTEQLFVGHDGSLPSDGSEAILAQQDLMAFLKTKQESADITCAVIVVSGETDTTVLRARAYQIMSAAEDALRTDLTMGGLVMQALISRHRYIPVITTAGGKARIVFTVSYLAQL